MSSFSFFIHRPRGPTAFQLVKLDFASTWVSSSATHPNVTWDSDAQWTPEYSEFLSADESVHINKVVRISQLVLVSNQGQRFRVCVLKPTTSQPRRGRMEVPVDSLTRIVTQSGVHFGNAMQQIAAEAASTSSTSSTVRLVPYRSRNDSIDSLPMRILSRDISIIPPPLPSPSKVVTKALPLFAASMIAKATLDRKEECPIEMEALTSFDRVLVAPCGHVCGPSAQQLAACPVCREVCQWTSVELRKQ